MKTAKEQQIDAKRLARHYGARSHRRFRRYLRVALPVQAAYDCALIRIHRDRMLLLDRTSRRSIRDIRAREFERPPSVVAAAGVELGGMIGEGEEVPAKKLLVAKPRGFKLGLGLFEPALRDQHIGKTPPDLGVAAGKRRQE